MKTDTIMITELFAFIIKTTSTHETTCTCVVMNTGANTSSFLNQ